MVSSTSVGRKPPKVKVYLRDDERDKLALAAFAYLQSHPHKNLTTVLKHAMQAVLPEDRRPTVNSVSEPRYAWFLDKMKEFSRNPPAIDPLPKPAPLPSVAKLTDLDPFAQSRPAQIRPTEPEPESLLADDQELWEADLLAEAKAEPEPAYVKRPRHLEILESDEREEWAMIASLRRRRSTDRELLEAIITLRQAIYSFTTQVAGFRQDLQLLPSAIKASTAELIRTQEAFLKSTAPAPPPRESRFPHPSPPPSANGAAHDVPVATVTPAKLKVVVVGYKSGHQVKGVEKEVAGRASLKFAPADPTMPAFSEYDYIVVPKECPKPWQDKAREKYARGKVVFATGHSQDVGRMIARLQPPEPRP